MSTPEDNAGSSTRLSTPFLLGEISAKLSGIDTSVHRMGDRLGSLEARTEKLEQSAARSSTWTAVVEKGVWFAVGAVGIALLKTAGIM